MQSDSARRKPKPDTRHRNSVRRQQIRTDRRKDKQALREAISQ